MKAWEGFRQLLFPPRCALCGRVLPYGDRGELLCGRCRQKEPFHKGEGCSICGGTLIGGRCYRCSKMVFSFRRGFCAFSYQDARGAIHRMKYKGYRKLGEPLGKLMAVYLKRYHADALLAATAVVSVPLYAGKKKQRGFDQAELLGRALAKELGLPYLTDALSRVRATTAQSKLSAEERRRNVAGAFRVKGKTGIAGGTLLLVDDIFTTGATLQACTEVLLAEGAAEVIPFALADAESGDI